MKTKKLERDVEKHREIAELAETRCIELEQELDALKAQRSTNFQQFEQLKKQFTDILVYRLVCRSVGLAGIISMNSGCMYDVCIFFDLTVIAFALVYFSVYGA